MLIEKVIQKGPNTKRRVNHNISQTVKKLKIRFSKVVMNLLSNDIPILNSLESTLIFLRKHIQYFVSKIRKT